MDLFNVSMLDGFKWIDNASVDIIEPAISVQPYIVFKLHGTQYSMRPMACLLEQAKTDYFIVLVEHG